MASYAENVSIWWRHHDNARLVERLSDWSLGLTKIPYLMLPPSHREEYFTLIRHQAQEKLLFMEDVPLAEADLCEKVAAIHTEMMTRWLASEESKRLFPLLRNRKAKLACSRAAARGNTCMETLPNTKQPWSRWRMPWSLPCAIKSSIGSPTGLQIGAPPLCVAATGHAAAVWSHTPGPHDPPGTLRPHGLND